MLQKAGQLQRGPRRLEKQVSSGDRLHVGPQQATGPPSYLLWHGGAIGVFKHKVLKN